MQHRLAGHSAWFSSRRLVPQVDPPGPLPLQLLHGFMQLMQHRFSLPKMASPSSSTASRLSLGLQVA